MFTEDHIDSLVENLPVGIEELEFLEGNEETGWCFRHREKLDLRLDWCSGSQALTSTIALSEVPSEKKVEIYEAMLAYNSLNSNRGGRCLGFDLHSGKATMTALASGENLGSHEFCAILANLLEVAESWNDFLSSDRIGKADEAPSSETMEFAVRI